MYCKPKKKSSDDPEDKAGFVRSLGFIMQQHDIQGVKWLGYREENGVELVDIKFLSGGITVNVTGDSCLTIMSDIVKALT